MIRKCLFIFLMLCSFESLGQRVAIEIASNDDRTIKIYSSYYNRVKLLVENVACNNIVLKGENLEIIDDSSCTYYLRALNKDDGTKLKIFNGNALVKEYQFIIDQAIPMPMIDINGGKAMERRTVLNNKVDSVFCRPRLIDKYNNLISFSVVSFKVTLKRGDKIIYCNTINGNKFPYELKSRLQELKYKDIMILDHIVIKDNNKNMYKALDAIFGAY